VGLMLLRAGTFLQNRYEIIKRIGGGGMSEVYKAKCHKLNRYVAIKVLKEEFGKDANFVKKFNIEAQAAAGLSHPNIVNIYDVVNENNMHFIVMELIEGITLKDYIASKGMLDIKEAINIALQVAKGLECAHERNIVHRDVKPQNIIISVDGTVKVADFGIAKATTEETINAFALGSVHYISPEQAKGAYTDIRSDIYSLGVSLYEMISGRVPFNGENAVAVALAHVEEVVTPPSIYNSKISPELETIVLKCMQKSPDRRYQNLKELIRELQNLLIQRNDTSAEVDSQTRMIDKSDIVSINSIRRDNAVPSNRTDDSYVEEREEEEKEFEDEVKDKKKKKTATKDKDADKEDKKMDSIMTALGAGIAVIIVVVILFFIIRFSGWTPFPKNEESKNIISTESSSAESETSVKADVEVPNITELPQEVAKTRLESLSLKMAVASSKYDDEISKDYIISQTPYPKAKVSKGDTVEVVISLGKEPIDLSKLNLSGISTEAATKILEGKGLKVSVVDEFSDNIEEDMLIRYSPSTAEEGHTVTLYNSKGKKVNKIKVPSLVNKDEESAVALIQAAGLTVGDVKTVNSTSVEKGYIISQDVKADSEVEPGSSVGYSVSAGPPPETTQAATQATQAYKYIASIDTTYNIADLIGPASSTTSVKIMIRLKQNVSGQVVYTTLMEPRKLTGDTILPVKFKSIEGAYGVDQGEVEVVETNSNSVLKSYTVEFFKVQ
ncbi:MAG: Stk1 family PASTA domain-containing Ser/Thr kinase, partial [Catonella sp.]